MGFGFMPSKFRIFELFCGFTMSSKFRVLEFEGQGCGGAMVANLRCEFHCALCRMIRRDGIDR